MKAGLAELGHQVLWVVVGNVQLVFLKGKGGLVAGSEDSVALCSSW